MQVILDTLESLFHLIRSNSCQSSHSIEIRHYAIDLVKFIPHVDADSWLCIPFDVS